MHLIIAITTCWGSGGTSEGCLQNYTHVITTCGNCWHRSSGPAWPHGQVVHIWFLKCSSQWPPRVAAQSSTGPSRQANSSGHIHYMIYVCIKVCKNLNIELWIHLKSRWNAAKMSLKVVLLHAVAVQFDFCAGWRFTLSRRVRGKLLVSSFDYLAT